MVEAAQCGGQVHWFQSPADLDLSSRVGCYHLKDTLELSFGQ